MAKSLAMFRLASLILPAIVPSWRFFDGVAPSPRIEFTYSPEEDWQELRPKPAQVTIREMLKRLVYNRHWNENLYMVSCAERLMLTGSAHAKEQILARIRMDHPDGKGDPTFRLVFVHRDGTELIREVTYTSRDHEL
jgi:hypothetical protein